MAAPTAATGAEVKHNAELRPTDADLSRQVACTDGLCGNGSEVGDGDTAMKGKR